MSSTKTGLELNPAQSGGNSPFVGAASTKVVAQGAPIGTFQQLMMRSRSGVTPTKGRPVVNPASMSGAHPKNLPASAAYVPRQLPPIVRNVPIGAVEDDGIYAAVPARGSKSAHVGRDANNHNEERSKEPVSLGDSVQSNMQDDMPVDLAFEDPAQAMSDLDFDDGDGDGDGGAAHLVGADAPSLDQNGPRAVAESVAPADAAVFEDWKGQSPGFLSMQAAKQSAKQSDAQASSLGIGTSVASVIPIPPMSPPVQKTRAQQAPPNFSHAPAPRARTALEVSVARTRENIHAVKVVTQLVAGVAFDPGFSSDAASKSRVLREQLVLLSAGAKSLAQAANVGNKSWAIADCAQTLAGMIAQRSERAMTHPALQPSESSGAQGHAASAVQSMRDYVQNNVSLVSEILKSGVHDGAVDEVLRDLGGKRYISADDPVIVRDRLNVSLAAALWELHDKVSGAVYHYAQEPSEVVRLLSAQVVGITLQTSAQIESQDMRTAHMQGSMRRLCALIGSEYAARAAKARDWIQIGQAIGDYERADYVDKIFASTTAPEIVAAARQNFMHIEKIAPQLLEDAWGQAAAQAQSVNSAEEFREPHATPHAS